MKIVNKFGQTLTSYSDIIYYSKKVKNGMTKKQVKCVPGWRYPEDTTQSSFGTIWYYSDGSYVIFNTKGKVDYWYIS